MIYDKKGVTAQRAKDKLSVIQSYFDKIKMGDEWYDDLMVRLEKLPYQEWPEPPRNTYATDEELLAYKKYVKGKYFSSKEKDVIIDYLLDCLVNNEVFEYSTLGPNIYKNEHSISNVSDTQL